MQKIVDSNKKIAVFNSLLVLSLGLLTILIWQFDLVRVKNLFPGHLISNPVTALCFITGIISFFFLISINPRLHSLGKILALIVFLVGSIRFLEVILNFNTGIDRWLFYNKLFLYGTNGHPDFMAPNTACLFAVLGVSLFLYRHRISQKNVFSDFFALVVAFLSFVSMIGYLFHSLEFYKLSSYIPMAFPTALSFFLSSISVLLYRSEFGFFSVFTVAYSGARIARFLMPFAIAIPIIAGLLRMYGEQAGLYSASFGVVFFETATITAFILLIWRCSVYLNRSGEALAKMEEQLRLFNKDLEQKVVDRTNEILKNKVRFRSMIENSIDVVSIIDSENKLVYVTPSVEKIIGFTPGALVGAEPYSFIHPRFIRLAARLRKEVTKLPGLSKTARLMIRHRDGHYIWMEGTITNLLQDEYINGIVNNFHEITEQVEAEDQKKMLEQTLVDEKINQQKDLVRAAIDGQENEKKLIGMELHDNINQVLASANIYLGIASSNKTLKDEMIEKSKQQVAFAINEIRNLSKSLVPHGIEAGGVMEAITDIIETIRLLSEIKCHTSLSARALDRLNPKEQLAVYRIIQEQVNNILKHAQASNLHVTLEEENDQVQLCIEDDGKGFDPASKREGIGLSNIKSRVELLNGKMKIESAAGQGCKLLIVLPAHQTVSSPKSLITTHH